MSDIIEQCAQLFSGLSTLPLEVRIETINGIRLALHRHSPFSGEPVDCVLWIENQRVMANDYNPNTVAPPEMELLELSISNDGYTQPIVSWEVGNGYEVVDGFHRNRIGKECLEVATRVHGYLPITVINQERADRGDRVASTIRHNRARGKHSVGGMIDIVVDLKKRNWSDSKIGRELGMDPDEVLRLTQISGLAEMFQNRDFSAAWEADEGIMEEEISGEQPFEVIEDEE